MNDHTATEPPQAAPAVGAQVDRRVRPCPFCGGCDVGVYEGDTFRWRLARCNGCGAQAGDVRIQTAGSGTRAEWEARAEAGAIAEWNKRAPT